MELRFQTPTVADSGRYHRLSRAEQWQPGETAVIVCDMWDAHHCLNAVRRVNELAPRIEQFTQSLRGDGVTIIHAPSSCMEAYQKHAARLRSIAMPSAASVPEDIASWCDQIPAEETIAYPLDQADGGEDDDLDEHSLWAAQLQASGRDPRAPWVAQCAAITIDEQTDYISDSGVEIWNILEGRKIRNVILVGVHTNMCVLGRPFGLRRLATAGKNVVLARDLTDTMYDPRAWPYASHFTGTDLIVQHIERYVCPTISSGQILGDAFRFSGDQRPRLVMLISEDEYKTEESLPKFAAKHLSQHFSVSTIYSRDGEPNQLESLAEIQSADAMLVSVRRRTLPAADLEMIRAFVRSGRPMIGIRTASHAFSLRNAQPAVGLAVWPEFDAEVWGGSYTNHYGNQLSSTLSIVEPAPPHPILSAIGPLTIMPGGSLYKTAPLAAGTQALLMGAVAGEQPEPVAWTYVRRDGGRSFYTSLGHVDDFAQPPFEALLSAGIHWACGLEPHALQEVEQQNKRYATGQGRQRK
ncbi:MAG: ThuA domain-containing protein [Pirellulaceae bacterium]